MFSLNAERRRQFFLEIEPLVGASVRPVDSSEEAIDGVDMIVCATNSYEPVFDGRQILPGQHIGSVQVGELDDLTHERADIIGVRAMDQASTWSQKAYPQPADSGWLECWKPEWNPKMRELGLMAASQVHGRDSSNDITLFGGIGTGPSSGLGIQYAPAGVGLSACQGERDWHGDTDRIAVRNISSVVYRGCDSSLLSGISTTTHQNLAMK